MLQFRASLGPISRLGRGHTGLLFRTQVALLLAYCGTRYQGLQKNPGAVTVEETLEAAIHRAGGITDDNVGTLQKVSWSRAGRTDKGVHAVGQIIGAKLVGLDLEALRSRVNDELEGSEVRVLGLGLLCVDRPSLHQQRGQLSISQLFGDVQCREPIYNWMFDCTTTIPAL